MTQKEQIADLKEQNEILFFQHQQTAEKLDLLLQKHDEAPKEKVGLASHYQTFVENAIKAPISTLSGLGVAVSYAATTAFPQYAHELESLKTFFELAIGVSAGGKVSKKVMPATMPKAQVPEHKTEEYG